MIKMELIAQPGDVTLRPTASRDGALGAAIAHMIECGHRKMQLEIGADRQCFKVLPADALDSEDSVEWRRIAPKPPKQIQPGASISIAQKMAIVRGRPPASGWSELKMPLLLERDPSAKAQAAEYFIVHAKWDEQTKRMQPIKYIKMPDYLTLMRKAGRAGNVILFAIEEINKTFNDEGIPDDVAIYLCYGHERSQPLKAFYQRYRR